MNSIPFPTSGGLARRFAADELPVNLDRGPTPLGESYKLTRRTIEVGRVSAGSNPDKAGNSVDDDETTDWTSNGTLAGSWIEYELAASSTIDQVVLKLVGWRTQSYPIKISVDGRVVFTGTTPRSLGYVTLNFPPALGKMVRIELTGEASNRDAFGNIVEIGGAPDPRSAAAKGGKSTLGIVEAEFYSTVTK
jgi:hypothetical protein